MVRSDPAQCDPVHLPSDVRWRPSRRVELPDRQRLGQCFREHEVDRLAGDVLVPLGGPKAPSFSEPSLELDGMAAEYDRPRDGQEVGEMPHEDLNGRVRGRKFRPESRKVDRPSALRGASATRLPTGEHADLDRAQCGGQLSGDGTLPRARGSREGQPAAHDPGGRVVRS
jgi:hypothetical protein